MPRIKLLVLFSYGISLKTWSEMGHLERELRLYRALADKGVDVTFLTYGGKEDLSFKEQCSPVKIRPVYSSLKRPRNKWLAAFHSFLFPLYFKGDFKSADILKTNQMLGSWVAVAGKLLYRRKLVVRCGYEMLLNAAREGYPWFLRRLMYCLEYAAYRTADRIFHAGRSGMEYMTRTFPFTQKRGRTDLVPNFVDTDLFQPSESRSAGDNGMGRTILYVGRLTREKNLHLVIKALEGTGIGLHVVGDGEQKQELIRLSSDLGVNADFPGTMPNDRLPGILNRHPVFVLPSLYENHPKALLEAMSCGMIVIGTKVSGIEEVIQHGENGFLCEPEAGRMKEVILKVFSDMDHLDKVRKNARRYVEENCSLATITSREIEIYNRLLGKGNMTDA